MSTSLSLLAIEAMSVTSFRLVRPAMFGLPRLTSLFPGPSFAMSISITGAHFRTLRGFLAPSRFSAGPNLKSCWA